MNDAKAFDKDLALRLKRNIRDAAKPVVAEVKRKAQEAPPGGGRRSVGTRAAIARGVGVRIGTGKRGGSVTIAASPRYLPPERRAMVRAYNAPSFRHPVFGNRDVWRSQSGNPYFGSVILANAGKLRAAVEAALNEAAAALGRKR